MGMALRLKRGSLTKPSTEVKKVAKSMSASKIRDFAKKPGIHSKPIRYHNRSV